MDISIFLARVLGLYLLLISVPLLFNFYYLEATFIELLTNKAISFIFSLITLILGILLIVSHNIWVADWRLIITLLAWTIFIKGVARLYYPSVLHKLSDKIVNPKFYMAAGIGCAVVGAILAYHGFLIT